MLKPFDVKGFVWRCLLAIIVLGMGARTVQSQTFKMESEPESGGVLQNNHPLAFGDWLVPEQLGYSGTVYSWQPAHDTQIDLWSTARFAHLADLRLQFSGQEDSFYAEAATLLNVTHAGEGWTTAMVGEFYLNQVFDDNVLTDYALRESFSHNFDIDSFEVSQLFVSIGRGNWSLDLGRFVTPFGRYYVSQYSNLRQDAPFIRTESILPRETGLQVRYNPGHWQWAAAITNGSDGRDTNSSKAIVSRIGIQREFMTVGASVKWQDGIGSEGQKQYNNHAGLDCMFRYGAWRFSSEWIYDQYGLRRPGFPLDQIDWGRSIYNRQLNAGLNQPIDGWGWYSNATYQTARLKATFGFGEFHPNPIGNAVHDTTTRRVYSKLGWRFNQHLEGIVTGIFENQVENAQDGRLRMGVFLQTGLQFHF